MAESLLAAVLQQQLTRLKMPTVRREFEGVARRARDGDWPYEEFLRELLDTELAVREQKAAARRLREARFPDLKTLNQIDWKALQGVSKTKVLALASGDFIDSGEDVVLAGPVGTGKVPLGHRSRSRSDSSWSAGALYPRGRSGAAAGRGS